MCPVAVNGTGNRAGQEVKVSERVAKSKACGKVKHE